MFENPRKRLENLFGQLIDGKEDKIIHLGGLLGTYDSAGTEIIDVENRPDFVYVRIGGNFSEVIEAFNQTVFPEFDTKVLLQKSPLGNFYEVISRDLGQYNTWGGNSFYSSHALQHSFGSGENEGSDPVFIYKRQLLQPLSVHPNATGSMKATIEADFYIWNNTIKYYPGGETIDFTSLLPTGVYSRYVTVYLNGDTETIEYITGSTFESGLFTTGTADYIPEVDPTQGIPLSAVYLGTGTSEIDWDHLFDIRNFLNAGGVNIPVHGLNSSYHSGTLPANLVVATDIGNYYTGSTVEDILQEIYPRTTGSSGSGGHVIKDETTSFTQRGGLKFVSQIDAIPLTIVDEAGDNNTTVYITGSLGGHGHYVSRYNVTGTTYYVDLPMLVNNIDAVFLDGFLYDPTDYTLSGSYRVSFNSPITNDGTVVVNYNTGSATGLAGTGIGLHALDPLYGYHSGTLRASLSTVVDAGNYYTGTVVEDVLQEIYPRTTGSTNPVAVDVTFASDQTIPTGTNAVTWDTERYDTLGLHDNSVNPSRLTVPVSGIYFIHWDIRLSSITPGRYEITVRRNGTTNIYASQTPPIAYDENVSGSLGWNLNAGDYIELLVRNNTASTRTIFNMVYSNFGMFLLR